MSFSAVMGEVLSGVAPSVEPGVPAILHSRLAALAWTVELIVTLNR